MQKEWVVKEPDLEIIEALKQGLKRSSVLCQVLANRGITCASEAELFLNPDLNGLSDPFLLKDMDRAVERIKRAIRDKEKILVFSDYDVDGITSCVLLKKYLVKMGAQVTHYIPNRISEGYGLGENTVSMVSNEKVSLLITLDCGITSCKEIEALTKKGIDVIVVDHHSPKLDMLPCAYAVVNPRRKDCSYRFKDLAAVGLVYKLICALGVPVQNDLDLVALGTIADVTPLLGENRIIVQKGLESINSSSNIGIKALIETSGLKNKKISPSSVSFILAPRINASGRVDSAEEPLKLFFSRNYDEALGFAANLNTHNRLRQKIEEGVLKEAIELVSKMHFKDQNVIVLSGQDWHIGVLGIVASKIAERFFRPAIVLSLQNGKAKGSGRSIPGFHLFDALLSCSHHLEEFGGHAQAVGLSIERDNIEDFTQELNHVSKNRFSNSAARPLLGIDAQLPLVLVNADLAQDIEELEPFGFGNPKPVFCSHNLTIKSSVVHLGANTIKFWVSDGERTYETIGFGMKDLAPYIMPSRKIDLAYNISLDRWQEKNSVLLEVKDIKFVS